MENSYHKFRFRNRELIKKYGDKTVKDVFEDVWFFVNEFDSNDFSYNDIMFYVRFGMNERGQMIPGIDELAEPVINFISQETGLNETPYDLYEDIYNVVSEVLPLHISNPEKYIEALARSITDEFMDGDRSLTMDDIAIKLKTRPDFRFIPLPVLEAVMDSVYDYFMKLDFE